MRHIQDKNGDAETNGEKTDETRVRLDGGGYFDTDIYESSKSKYSEYNQSIAVDDNEVCTPILYIKFSSLYAFLMSLV